MEPRRRFFANTDLDDNGCLIWQGTPTVSGYGRFSVAGERERFAHRWAWYFEHGKFPDHTIDHLCKNRICVNVAHLRDIPQSRQAENAERWQSRKTECPRGHAYEGDNLLIKRRRDGSEFRQCRQCQRDYLHAKRGPEKPVHRGPRRG